jgi:hypothetical protein
MDRNSSPNSKLLFLDSPPTEPKQKCRKDIKKSIFKLFVEPT